MQDSSKKLLFYTGLILLSFIFFNILTTSILFLVKISITIYNFILGGIFTLLFTYIILKKAKYSQKKILLILGGISIIISVAIASASLFYDTTYDGNNYHKVAVGSLKNGWNPNYELIEEFNVSDKNSLVLNPNNGTWLWTNHYAKGYWYYAASIYSLTNNIESGKSLYFILVIAAILIIISYLIERTKRIELSIGIAFLLIVNPVTIVQIFTYYNDGLLGILIILLIFSLIMIHDDSYKITNSLKFILLIFILTVVINLKFTGFVFAAFYCLAYFINALVNYFKYKNNKQMIKNYLLAGFLSLVVSLGIVGSATYIKNIKYGHPFYPLYGENKVDIITFNQPKSFGKLTNIHKFLISTFSKTDNIMSTYGDASPLYKIPGVITQEELKNLSLVDIRISGFGLLFSIILILSLLILIIHMSNAIKEKTLFNKYLPFYLPMLITLIIIFILEGSWWARYIPQLYIVPIIALILSFEKNNKKSLILPKILISLMAINIYYFVSYNTQAHLENSIKIRRELKKLKKGDNVIINPDEEFAGAIYNFYDVIKKIEITDDEIEEAQTLLYCTVKKSN